MKHTIPELKALREAAPKEISYQTMVFADHYRQFYNAIYAALPELLESSRKARILEYKMRLVKVDIDTVIRSLIGENANKLKQIIKEIDFAFEQCESEPDCDGDEE